MLPTRLAPALAWLPLLLSACAQPRMVPPGDVAQGAVLDVKNRNWASGAFVNENFDLGAYKVAKVKRSWIHGDGFSAGPYSSNRSTATYSYELQGGQQAWKGTCSISKDEKNVKLQGGLGFGGSKAGVACECADGTHSGRAELNRSRSGKFEGRIVPAGQEYILTPVKETDKQHWGSAPVGYRFDGTDGARGAVEMLRPGRIWFAEKMPGSEREPGACLLAGLMLYTEPSDHDD